MIISLFKNCDWVQQFNILIELFKWNIFHEEYLKKHANMLVNKLAWILLTEKEILFLAL